MLYILTGMSASGKDTVLTEMVNNRGIERIVSTTTRPMRDGEIDGVDYNFVSQEEFENGIRNNDFLEYRKYRTTVGGQKATWYYGSRKMALSPRKDYAVVLDMDGARDFVAFHGKNNCFVVNIKASDDIREKRASSRGSFDKIEWDRRLEDDKIKFSNDIVNGLANFFTTNEGDTIETIADDIIMASKVYLAAKEEDSYTDVIITYSNSPDCRFNVIDRYHIMGCSKIQPYVDMGLNDDQLIQIRCGIMDDIDVSIYAKPEFNADQMKVLRRHLEAGVDVSSYAKPEISANKMSMYRLKAEGHLKGIDPEDF